MYKVISNLKRVYTIVESIEMKFSIIKSLLLEDHGSSKRCLQLDRLLTVKRAGMKI